MTKHKPELEIDIVSRIPVVYLADSEKMPAAHRKKY